MQTSLNNQQFVAERTAGATKFLNVLQGRTEPESKAWYDAVKVYPFEGWAFAGGHRTDFSLLLQRLIDLRDDDRLGSAQWVHVLGKSELDMACLYTVVQRAVRRHINPTLQFSFDSASHALMAANHQMYAGAFIDKAGWSMESVALTDRTAVGSTTALAQYLADKPLSVPRSRLKKPGYFRKFHRINSGITRNLSVGDICVNADGNSPWDTASYHLIANHNAEALISAMKLAHDTFFHPPDELKIPVHTRIVRDIIDMVFTSDQPDKLIKECRAVLHDVT